MTRSFRGKNVRVEVHNPASAEKGVKKLVLNGETLEGNFIPAEKLVEENRAVVEMG